MYPYINIGNEHDLVCVREKERILNPGFFF